MLRRSGALLAALLLGAAAPMGMATLSSGLDGVTYTRPSIGGSGRGRSRKSRSNEHMVATKAGGRMQAWGVKKNRNKRGKR